MEESDDLTVLSEFINAQREFMQETYSSVSESILASFSKLIESLSVLYSSSKTINKKLIEDTDRSISTYESSRLRSFGRFRINLDSIIRGMKEEMLRNIRVKLGFTPIGEPVFSDRTPVPDLPSAVTIAETFANNRKLIERAFKSIEEKTKSIIEEKKEKYFQSISDLSSQTQDEVERFTQIHSTALKKREEYLGALLEEFKSKTKQIETANGLLFDNSRSYILFSLDSIKNELTHSLDLIFSRYGSTIDKLNTEHINKLQTFMSEIDKTFDNIKATNKKEKISKITELISNDIGRYNEIAETTHNLFNNKIKRIKQHKKEVSNNINKSNTIHKELDLKLNKLKEISKTDPENIDFLIDDIMKLSLELQLNSEELNEKTLSFTDEFENQVKQSKKLIDSGENYLEKIKSKEKEISKIVWQFYNANIDTIYRNIKSSLEFTLQQISLEILDIQKNLEDNLGELKSSSLSTIDLNFEDVYKNINDDFSKQKEQWESHYNSFSSKLLQIYEELQEELHKLANEQTELFRDQKTQIDNKLTKIMNTIQIDMTQLFTELRNTNDEMSIAIINKVNTLESELGDEYEQILDFFDKSRETTLGTAKMLLDDLSSYMRREIDSIWTSVLKEFNTLQEVTKSTLLAKKIINNIRDSTGKIEINIEDRSKEAKNLIDIFDNSLKVAFDELQNKIKNDWDNITLSSQD